MYGPTFARLLAVGLILIEGVNSLTMRIDVEDLNVYYGDFLAVEGASITMAPLTVTAFIGPSGCGKSTVLRTLNRMHEVIIGGWITGSVRLDGHGPVRAGVDPVNVRRTVGMVFQQPNPFPTMTVYDNVAAGYQLAGIRKSKNDMDGIVESSLKRANLWEEVKHRLHRPGAGAVRRSAAAAVHCPSHRRRTHRAADGRALLRPGPDLHPGHRRPDRRTEGQLHHRHRHPQHAAGRPNLRPHRVLQPHRCRPAGPARGIRRHQTQIFSAPSEKTTEDYISGRFG